MEAVGSNPDQSRSGRPPHQATCSLGVILNRPPMMGAGGAVGTVGAALAARFCKATTKSWAVAGVGGGADIGAGIWGSGALKEEEEDEELSSDQPSGVEKDPTRVCSYWVCSGSHLVCSGWGC